MLAAAQDNTGEAEHMVDILHERFAGTCEGQQRREPASSADRFASLAEFSATGLASVSPAGLVLYANKAWLTMTGVSAACIEGRQIHDHGVLSASLRPEVMAAVALANVGGVFDSVIGQASSDPRLHHRLRGRAVTSGDVGAQERGGSHAACTAEILLSLEPCQGVSVPGPGPVDRDPVTGLCGRRGLHPIVERALLASRRSAHVVAVLFIDLDGFKSVNDGLGHASGDRLLHAVAKRVSEAVRGAQVWRYGGDEFVVLLDGLVDPRVAWSAADRILANVARPVSVGHHEITPTCSIGVALADSEVASGAELVSRADDAMYRAKAKGGGRVERFDRELAHQRSRIRSFEQDLGVALDQGEMEVHYQPEFDLVSGQILGLEALLRWRHAEHGLLEAGSFLQTALDLGLGADLATHVIDRVCREATSWQSKGIELDIRVNLSPVQIERSIVERILRVVDAFGVDPTCLVFEIREPDQPSQGWVELLSRLRKSGARVALDHFGTGSLSISQLRDLPVDSIKIDGGFLAGLGQGDADRSGDLVLAAMIQLAAALDLDISADRIESAPQKAALVSHGCRRGQGYLLAAPLSPSELEPFVLARLGSRASVQSSGPSSASISSPSSAAVAGPSSGSVLAFAE